MARPKVIIDCVASRWQGPDERIVEISHCCGGGLINIRATSTGRLVIDLHQLDDTVEVHIDRPLDRARGRGFHPRRPDRDRDTRLHPARNLPSSPLT
ncbi:hypothetical protein [Nocardia sp. CA-119907]|uniref:hypothetical protein n=1 Tax=Nocardia sp. CA-119907 TaxID=3239973 RepID=UPI003D9977D1